MKYCFATLMITLAFAGTAFALKPFQKEAEQKFTEELTETIDATNKACGVKLPVKSNFDALKAEDWEGQSISSRCDEVLSAIQRVCQKTAYKEELVKRIKEVQCLFGGKDGDDNAKTMANMSITGATFVFRMHKNNVNVGDNAQTVIEKALNE